MAIEPARGVFRIRTPAADLFSRWVVNAAGLHADSVARALDPTLPRAYPCRGEYLLLDKEAGERVRLPVYPVPPAGGAGLGVHVTPTVDGNVLIGPSAEYLSNREDTACTEAVMTRLTDEVGALWPSLPAHRVIATFAGIRAKLSPPEQGGYAPFFIEPSHEYPRLINLLGLESPALSAAPAIADRVVHEIIGAAERLDEKPPSELRQRRWPDRFDDLSEAEKARRVAADPDHGEIVCRCEGVTRHEVLHALANPLGVRTLTGLKYRCRITMGRCSGGYCLPRFVEMMRSEHRWSPERFTLRDARSPLFAGWVKEPNDGCG